VIAPAPLWRAFEWDAAARPGTPGSPSFVPSGQHGGRFDQHDQPPILYLAESAAHALGEVLQAFRGRTLRASHLFRNGKPLAVVRVELPPAVVDVIADCTDAATLQRLHIRPDELAHHDRVVTQAVGRRIYNAGVPGFRWWSALTGGWHSVVLFVDRCPPKRWSWGTPERVTPTHPAVVAAAERLGITLPV
jgi:hypothetical protein